MKKPVKYLLIIVIGILLNPGGCKRPNKEQDRVLVVLKTLQATYFQEMRGGIVKEAPQKLSGVELDIKSGAAEGDIGGQLTILDEYARRYIDTPGRSKLLGVIITPASSGPELVPALTRFMQANIPVVVLDTQLLSSEVDLSKAYAAFRGSDNKLGGEIAGEQVKHLLPNGGKILLLNGLDGQETAAARRDGFLSQFRGLDSFLITQRTCNWDKEQARAMVAALLDAGQTFDAVFGANDEMALGALEARRQKGLSAAAMPIIGFDATDVARKAVREKRLHATIAQNPSGMGAAGIEVLAKLIAGERVERDVLVPVQVVDK